MNAPAASGLASVATRRRTVLVVDDEAPIRENLIRFLRLEGFRVIDAAKPFNLSTLQRRIQLRLADAPPHQAAPNGTNPST